MVKGGKSLRRGGLNTVLGLVVCTACTVCTVCTSDAWGGHTLGSHIVHGTSLGEKREQENVEDRAKKKLLQLTKEECRKASKAVGDYVRGYNQCVQSSAYGGRSDSDSEKVRSACSQAQKKLLGNAVNSLKQCSKKKTHPLLRADVRELLAKVPYCDGESLVPILQLVNERGALSVDLDRVDVDRVDLGNGEVLRDFLHQGILVVDKEELRGDNEDLGLDDDLGLIKVIEILQDPENKILNGPENE